MRALAANVEEVFREAAARWTLVAYFALSSLFVLIFAIAVNLDVVDGALAGAKLFGQNVEMGRQTWTSTSSSSASSPASRASSTSSGRSSRSSRPRTSCRASRRRGRSTSTSRAPSGACRSSCRATLGGLLLAASNVVYLIGAMWLLVIWKTDVVHPRFFFAAGSSSSRSPRSWRSRSWSGVVTSSTAVSIMATFAIFFVSAILSDHDQIEAAMSSEWAAQLVHGLYWVFPKTAQLGHGRRRPRDRRRGGPRHPDSPHLAAVRLRPASSAPSRSPSRASVSGERTSDHEETRRLRPRPGLRRGPVAAGAPRPPTTRSRSSPRTRSPSA